MSTEDWNKMAKATEEAVERDLESYLGKPPTVLQARFVQWIKEYVGYDPAAAKTKGEAFAEGVRIATATRMVFQASDFNREANAAAKKARDAELEAAAEEAPKPRKAAAAKAAPAPKKATRKAAAPAPEPEEETEEETETEEVETPASATRKPTRRPARRAMATAEAPF